MKINTVIEFTKEEKDAMLLVWRIFETIEDRGLFDDLPIDMSAIVDDYGEVMSYLTKYYDVDFREKHPEPEEEVFTFNDVLNFLAQQNK